jgi:hypothetical protein
MNIPFDNLYHYIESRLDDPAVLYLFFPAGSRKIIDLKLLRDYPEQQIITRPKIICHDQEPLCWNQYTDLQFEMHEHRSYVNQKFFDHAHVTDWLQLENLNLDQATCYYGGISIFDRTVLLHSEINSVDLDRYEKSGFIPAYWLSHAMIARDWYRFARHDRRLDPSDHFQPFLIYSRGFTGSREYRPKFLEQLCQMGLAPFARVSCLHQENQQELCTFQPTRNHWRLDLPHLVTSLPHCQVSSSASADYDAADISSTACQIVLETRFDGSCLHLTEKTFRPIATAQPFMLLAAPGALALLRRYGFETYDGLIDESYDLISHGPDRMKAVLSEMARLCQMSASQWARWRAATLAIAQRNQARFFSEAFEKQVWDECLENINSALTKALDTRGAQWLLQRRLMRARGIENSYSYLRRPNEREKAKMLRHLRQGRYTPSHSADGSDLARTSSRDCNSR